MKYNFNECTLCPRMCRINRNVSNGICGVGIETKVAKASLHMWEEPCISGEKGSGTIFFSGCTLKCCFCQNHKISHESFGKEISKDQLSDIFLKLQDDGAENINLVTGTQYVPRIISAIDKVRHNLNIPIIYNSSGYERVETIKMLEGYIDVYLPDLKYYSKEISKKYSKAENYFEFASTAILEMHQQQPKLEFENNMLKKGLIIRHLILPRCRHDSIKIIDWINGNLPKDSFLLSLMSQYTPSFKSNEYPEINRKVTMFEYKSVLDSVLEYGIDGFTQEKSSAQTDYIPDFDLSGIE